MSTKPRKKPQDLRSQQWFGRQDRDGFAYRSWVKGKGIPHDQFDGRPVIGICNTFSELTPCNSHFRTLAEQVKIGVYEAGGFPLEFPVMSLGETLLRPTAMLYRNLASMDVEESDPRQPDRRRGAADGLRQDHAGAADGRGERRPADHRRVAAGRCSTASGAARSSARAPACGSMSEQVRAGTLKLAGLLRRRELHAPQPRPLHDDGHRLDDGQHGRGARHRAAGQRRLSRRSTAGATCSRATAGRRIVEMVHEDLKISTDPHARGVRERDPHAGRDRRLDQRGDPPDRDRRPARRQADARRLRPARPASMPCLVDLQPSGKHLMEDFCYAGGLPAVMKEIARPAAPRRRHRQRQDGAARTSPTRRTTTPT